MNDDWLLMGDIPDRAARLWKDNVALLFQGDRWTHGEFAADVEKVAKGLIALGVERGDHVAVWMTNRPEWLHLMYAIPRVGGCIVPLNTRYRTDDVAYTVVQSESKFLVALDRSGPINYGEMLTEAREEIDKGGSLETIVMLGEQIENSVSWETMLDGGDATVRSRWSGHRYFLMFIDVVSLHNAIYYMRDNSARSFVSALKSIQACTKPK